MTQFNVPYSAAIVGRPRTHTGWEGRVPILVVVVVVVVRCHWGSGSFRPETQCRLCRGLSAVPHRACWIPPVVSSRGKHVMFMCGLREELRSHRLLAGPLLAGGSQSKLRLPPPAWPGARRGSPGGNYGRAVCLCAFRVGWGGASWLCGGGVLGSSSAAHGPAGPCVNHVDFR